MNESPVETEEVLCHSGCLSFECGWFLESLWFWESLTPPTFASLLMKFRKWRVRKFDHQQKKMSRDKFYTKNILSLFALYVVLSESSSSTHLYLRWPTNSWRPISAITARKKTNRIRTSFSIFIDRSNVLTIAFKPRKNRIVSFRETIKQVVNAFGWSDGSKRVDKRADRHKNAHKVRKQTETHMHRLPGQTRGKPDRQTRRQTDGRTVRQIGKQADGQTNRQTHR